MKKKQNVQRILLRHTNLAQYAPIAITVLGLVDESSALTFKRSFSSHLRECLTFWGAEFVEVRGVGVVTRIW